MKPKIKGNIYHEYHGAFQMPAQWVLSDKYQSLSAKETKHFLNFLCMVHIQGGSLVCLNEARIAMGLYHGQFQALLEKWEAEELIKKTDEGHVPLDDWFSPYVPLRTRQIHKFKALQRETPQKFRSRGAQPKARLVPVAIERANSVIAFLNMVSKKNFITEINGKPSPAVERIADRLRRGETKVRDLKAHISQVGQCCRSQQEREEKLKPSFLF